MDENNGGSPRKEESEELSEEQARLLKEKIRSRLLVDKAVLLDELVELSADHISLEENGKVHIKGPEKRKGAELAALTLVGKKLAKLGGLCADDVADLSEILEATGLTQEVATARLSDLRKEGTVESPSRGKYRIRSLARARKVLSSIDSAPRQGGE